MAARQRAFILLFGTRAIVSDETGPAVNGPCPSCGRVVPLAPKSVRHWFTLFLIPLFPVSGRRPLMACPNCRAQFEATPRDVTAHAARADADANERAIALYNALRASPANAITLNALMDLYARAGEYDQAVAAAGQFPDALNASEQCMTTLARVYLAKNDPATALRWLTAATDRNPLDGEAQYYKAVAHLSTTPPDPASATTAARAARTAGHPGADALLRDAGART